MKQFMNEDNTIYFVYLGRALPDYGSASLVLAQKTSGSAIHLIGNQTMRQDVLRSGAGFTAIEEFYDQDKFTGANSNLTSDPKFREGFWIKSMERIFILEQFFQFRNLTTLFHAELDQLLFGTDKLISALNSIKKKGLFLPFHNKDAVIASILYVNDVSALQSVTQTAGSGESFSNEMMLLAKWATSNPERTFALPTLATELKGSTNVLPSGVTQITSVQIGGVVDAAQIGQWVGGIDPRNISIREKPRTKFVDEPSRGLLNRKDLESLTLELSKDCRNLVSAQGESTFQTYNLHLHSKSHRTILKGKPPLHGLFEKSNGNNPIEIPGTRRIQLSTYILKGLTVVIANPQRLIDEIKWRIKFRLNFRPTSYPFVSGDTFRKISQYTWEAKSRKIDATAIKSGDIIFCESELLHELKERVLTKLKVSVILILGNSDKNHTKLEKEQYILPSVAAVFAQNIFDEIPNFEVLPIGLENAWRSKHGVLNRRIVKRASTSKRKNRIMWGFNVGTNPVVRKEASSSLKRNHLADEIGNVEPRKHQALLSEYGFVASPPGNGLDTHRTWEAMYFRCVPIVLRSFMTSHYESLGLPIWVVESYSDIEALDEASLEEKYKQYSEKFSHEAIWANYWINLIQSTSERIKTSSDPSIGI